VQASPYRLIANLVNTADDQLYFYDINPLSNFVANAPQVVGFEPIPRFVDYILEQASLSLGQANRF
jgi:hypothetical protein